jgi:mannosyltransferase OCH1-like enzyme
MFKYIKSLIWQITNSIIKIFLELFVINKRVRRIMKGDFCKFYLRKYLKKASKENVVPESNSNEYVIWQLWEQRLENSPQIVRACLDSVAKYNPDIKRIILTKENIKEYVDIPDYIWVLKEKNVIKSAHFSDILRTYLLLQHGGCWIDATVLMTAPLPEYVKNADLFVLKADENADLDGLNMASYFISAKPNNKILQQTSKILEYYWKENNFLVNYFMFLHAFTMVAKRNTQEWENVPFFSFIPVQRMQAELLKPYNKERFEQFKTTSFIHKLTYKNKVMTKNKNFETKDTLLEAIIEGKIYD